jgi:hypothetical protein
MTANHLTRGEPHVQAGLRYSPIKTVDVDVIYGHNLIGERANWITAAVTVGHRGLLIDQSGGISCLSDTGPLCALAKMVGLVPSTGGGRVSLRPQNIKSQIPPAHE